MDILLKTSTSKNRTLLEKILSYIEHYQNNTLLPPGSTVILGLSGGPDSVFLLHVLHAYGLKCKITLIAAHLDHQWRPNSHEATEFCRSLTHNMGVTFETTTADKLGYTPDYNGSHEEVGRKMRRHFFMMLAEKYNASSIALAHHYDDQKETFFIRLIRGATLSGLVGMKVHEGLFVRPLLTIKKSEIMNYLNNNTIAYLTDPTNESQKFLRNRLRKMVLPSLHTVDSRFEKNFQKAIENLQKTESFLHSFTRQSYHNVITIEPDKTVWIILERLMSYDHLIQERIVMLWLQNHDVSFTPQANFIREILRFFVQKKGSSHHIHSEWKILKKKGRVCISKTGP